MIGLERFLFLLPTQHDESLPSRTTNISADNGIMTPPVSDNWLIKLSRNQLTIHPLHAWGKFLFPVLECHSLSPCDVREWVNVTGELDMVSVGERFLPCHHAERREGEWWLFWPQKATEAFRNSA
eukprot:scaffold75342_cov39-Attheya_sp.AAC.1